MKMKCMMLVLVLSFSVRSQAQVPIIGTVVAKVIKAIDLKVQRMQYATMLLQAAQEEAEQALSQTKLEEITAWQEKQEALYESYFNELREAKRSITGLGQVKRIIGLQAQVVTEYNRFGKDASVVAAYDALLDNSIEIVETLQTVIGAGISMKDSDRIVMITTLRDAMNQCLTTIKGLNDQQVRQAAANARMKADLQFVKRLNGIK